MPIRLVRVGELADAGAGDEYGRSPEIADAAAHRLADGGGIRDIDLVRSGGAAGGTDGGDRLLSTVEHEIEARDARALGREPVCGRATETRAGSGHHGGPSSESGFRRHGGLPYIVRA
jgi:hypothetical protein